jgi:hypothetical protein
MALGALLSLLAAAPSSRTFSEERLLLDRRLETLRRILPDAPNPAADLGLVRQVAEESGLDQFDLKPRPVDQEPGTQVIDLSALGQYLEIDRFFRQLALSHRLVDVETLELSATLHDSVQVKAVLRLPHWPRGVPLPSPPESARGLVRGLPRHTAEAFLRDQAVALAKSSRIAGLRRAQRNPRLFLAEIAAIARERPVSLTFASLAERFSIRGLTVGEGPVRAIEKRFDQGFFRVSEFLLARDGACRRFEVLGQSPVVGVQAELPIPSEDPFRQDTAPCVVDRDPGRARNVKGPSRKPTEGGPLTLRLRQVDAADVFRVLHLLTSASFVVDGDVRGPINVELSRVTLEEALNALRQQLELRIETVGGVRRVALAGSAPTPPLPAPTNQPPLASFALKRGTVREILAVMTEADPSLAALGPEGFLGQLSVWARDVSLLDLRAAILQAVGLAERLEEGQRILERTPGTNEAVTPVAGAAEERRLVVGPEEMSLAEFELAGLASSDGSIWIALAYSPRGVLHSYLTGARLDDAVIKAIYSTDIVLDSGDGDLRLALPQP